MNSKFNSIFQGNYTSDVKYLVVKNKISLAFNFKIFITIKINKNVLTNYSYIGTVDK